MRRLYDILNALAEKVSDLASGKLDADSVHVTDSGYSGNKRWRRWSDGTQECWLRIPIRNGPITTAWGSLFYGGFYSKADHTWPKPFLEAPCWTMSLNSNNFWAVSVSSVSGMGNLYVLCAVPKTAEAVNTENAYATVYATGRWK